MPNKGKTKLNQQEKRRRQLQAANDRARAKEFQQSSMTNATHGAISKSLRDYGDVDAILAAHGSGAISADQMSRALWLLRARLNPDDPSIGELRYPDSFAKLTATAKLFINAEVPRTLEEHGSNPQGMFSIVTRPEMDKPLWFLQDAVAGSAPRFNVEINGQSDWDGLFASAASAEFEAEEALELGDEWVNVVGDVQLASSDHAEWMNRGTTTDGSELSFMGIPGIDATATGFSTIINISTNQALTGFTFQARTINTSGPSAVPVTQAGGAGNTVQLVIPGASDSLDYGLPGTGIQLRLSVNPITPRKLGLSTISVLGRYVSNSNHYVPVEFEDHDELQGIVDKQRTVAMSGLLTYRGDILNAGGMIGSLHSEGGIPPGWMEFNSYTDVTSVQGSRDGTLIGGDYGWWSPSDPVDMSFKKFSRKVCDGFLAPFEIIMGQVSDVNQAIQLRFRHVARFEYTTTRQFIDVREQAPDPMAIELCARYERKLPHHMENPTHNKKVGSFLSKVGNGLWKFAKTAGRVALETAPLWAPLVLA